MTLIDDIHELAFGAADMLNNTSDKVTTDYKLGYVQGVLDGIVRMSKPEIRQVNYEQHDGF